MIWLIVIFVLSVAIFTLLVRFWVARMGRIAGVRARERLMEAEHIVNTGRLPDSWLARVAELEGPRKTERLLVQLDDLIRFFKAAPVVENEETRKVLLGKLHSVRAAQKKCLLQMAK